MWGLSRQSFRDFIPATYFALSFYPSCFSFIKSSSCFSKTFILKYLSNSPIITFFHSLPVLEYFANLIRISEICSCIFSSQSGSHEVQRLWRRVDVIKLDLEGAFGDLGERLVSNFYFVLFRLYFKVPLPESITYFYSLTKS